MQSMSYCTREVNSFYIFLKIIFKKSYSIITTSVFCPHTRPHLLDGAFYSHDAPPPPRTCCRHARRTFWRRQLSTTVVVCVRLEFNLTACCIFQSSASNIREGSNLSVAIWYIVRAGRIPRHCLCACTRRGIHLGSRLDSQSRQYTGRNGIINTDSIASPPSVATSQSRQCYGTRHFLFF